MQKHGYYQPTTSHPLVELKYYKPMDNATVADMLLEQPFIMPIDSERQAVINSPCLACLDLYCGCLLMASKILHVDNRLRRHGCRHAH